MRRREIASALNKAVRAIHPLLENMAWQATQDFSQMFGEKIKFEVSRIRRMNNVLYTVSMTSARGEGWVDPKDWLAETVAQVELGTYLTGRGLIVQITVWASGYAAASNQKSFNTTSAGANVIESVNYLQQSLYTNSKNRLTTRRRTANRLNQESRAIIEGGDEDRPVDIKLFSEPKTQQRKDGPTSLTTAHSKGWGYFYRIHPKAKLGEVIKHGLWSDDPNNHPSRDPDNDEDELWPDEDPGYSPHRCRLYLADTPWKGGPDRFLLRVPINVAVTDPNGSCHGFPLFRDDLGDAYISTGHRPAQIFKPKDFDVLLGGRWVRADLADSVMARYWRVAHERERGWKRTRGK